MEDLRKAPERSGAFCFGPLASDTKLWRYGRMNRRFLLAAGLSLLVSGCASVPVILAPQGSALAELEPLYLARADHRGLTIRVASNGCTRKEDFAFFVERKGEATSLAFGRKVMDPCRSLLRGSTELTFSYGELGLNDRPTVFLLNPLVAGP